MLMAEGKRHSNPIMCAAVAMMLFFFCQVSWAGDIELSQAEEDYLRQQNTIVFISQSNYPPFEFVGSDGDHTGMCIELVRWIATEIGFKALFTDATFKEAQNAVLSGKADILTSLFYSQKRDQVFDFTKVMFHVPASIFVKAERPDINSMNDLQGKVIAIQAGDYAQEFLESKNISFTGTYTKDFAEATDLVIAGKADAIIGDEQIVLYHIFSNHLTNRIKKVGEPLYTGQNCMGAKDPNPVLIGILNKGIELAQEKGSLDQINKKWIGTRYAPLQPWLSKLVPVFLLTTTCIMAAAILIWFWNLRLRQQVALRTKALSESEKTLRTILAASPVGIGLIRGPEIGWHNQAMSRMLGYQLNELEGRDVDILYENKNQLKLVTQALRTAGQEGGCSTVETKWVRKNRTVFDCLLRYAPLPSDDDKPLGIALAEDITDRKRADAERRNLEQRLHRAEKMEALGTMAGGVAHDLNNVLGVLVGYSELMLLKIPEDDPLRSHVNNILKSGLRGAAIIQDLLTLARRGVAVSEVVNLNHLITDFFKTPEFEKLSANYPEVAIRVELADDLLNIKGSPIHLSKTVMNLVSNAAEAISGAGEVLIQTENHHIDKPMTRYEVLPSGDYVVLTVRDSGKGISEQDISKIFEPFYTKKVMGRSGTGLGLAVVWGTVKDHHGHIDVVSEKEHGCTFTLYFPVSREPLAEKQEFVPLKQYLGQGESILVVDDVQEQRELAESMLHSIGYNVVSVSSGEEAVTYIKSHDVDLVVLDMIMDPGIDGLETYRRIIEVKPKQKAIIVSGFSETDRVKQALQLGAGAYIRKPYLMEKIGVAIKNELDRA
jgi:PAS domain S-box-containing protein